MTDPMPDQSEAPPTEEKEAERIIPIPLTSPSTPKYRQLDTEDLDRMCLPEELRRLKRAGVQTSVRHALDKYIDKITFSMEGGVGLLITGSEGVGKSGIASLCARAARSWGSSVFWTTVWELRDARRNRRMFDEEQSVMERCKEIELLVLDGLTDEDAIDRYYGWADILGLMRLRASRRKATILTTSIPPKDERIKSLLGAVSRIAHFHVTGENLRFKENEDLRTRLFSRESKDKEDSR